MKRTIQNGVVSPFLIATHPDAVEFTEDQNKSIDEAFAAGYVVSWDGKSLSLETDVDKAAELMASFNKAWQEDEFNKKLNDKANDKGDNEKAKVAQIKAAFSK